MVALKFSYKLDFEPKERRQVTLAPIDYFINDLANFFGFNKPGLLLSGSIF
jgi:hypothetical protein